MIVFDKYFSISVEICTYGSNFRGDGGTKHCNSMEGERNYTLETTLSLPEPISEPIGGDTGI